MKVNPVKAIVEMFLPHKRQFKSPLKQLPLHHPAKAYCYTLVGHNEKPLTVDSLLSLGFVGRIRGASDFIILEDLMLFKDINVVVQIAKFFNIPRIRKYTDEKRGIEWEGNTKDIYESLLVNQLFGNIDQEA